MFSNVRLRTKRGIYSAALYADIKQGILKVVLEDYSLTAPCFLNGLWEIERDSFLKYGNKYDFTIIDERDLEVGDFTLIFDFETYSSIQKEAIEKWHFEIVYNGNQQWIVADIPQYGRVEAEDMEAIFYKSTNNCVSCANCAYSGYERGSLYLFCLKEEGERLLQYPEQYNYHTWYGDLKRITTLETYYCDDFRE